MAKFTPSQALLALIFAPSAVSSLTSLYPPFQSGIAKKAFAEDPNLVSTPAELVGQRQKGLITNEQFVNSMAQAGYAPHHAETMLANARTYLSVLDYITQWRRGDMREDDLNETLRQQGLTDGDIAIIKDVTIYYPTPQDIIRFAIRDVYTTQTIEQYGLFQDYPDLLDAAAAKAGLPPDITKLYWGSHWELPSPTEVYEMFHRGFVTQQEMETYMKVADFMPFWRDKLIKLSFDPITRVDIRRMYSIGVLNEAQVTRRYQDLGYSPDDATLLTQFTVAEAHKSDGDATSAIVIASYKAGTVDRATAFTQLQSLKVNDDLANTLLDNADAGIKQELIDLEADAIIQQYQSGAIDLNEVQVQLTRIGVPARMMQLTIQRELAQARKRLKSASKSDLDSWWKTGVMGSKNYRTRMTALGYSQADITGYLAELQFGELTGVDKKYSWAKLTREYNDGDILKSTVIAELENMGLAPETIQIVTSVAIPPS